MAHIHSVYDSDTHFTINPITRALRNTASSKTSVIQFDHNSERFTFEVPRMIEGHDMAKCNVVRVHYINIDATTKAEVKGTYEVDDMQISPNGDDVVICSWLISRNATQLVGSLNFLVQFACVTKGGGVDYVWNTAIYTGISVSSGIDNNENVVEQYVDVLEKWKNELEQLARVPGATEQYVDEAVGALEGVVNDLSNTQQGIVTNVNTLGLTVKGLSDTQQDIVVDVDTLSTQVDDLVDRMDLIDPEGITDDQKSRPVILAVGDSICKGGSNGGKGFIGELGVTYVNKAVSGSTLGTLLPTQAADQIIHKQIKKAHDEGVQADIIIANGGINDYIFDCHIGTVPARMAESESYFRDKSITNTALGGLEHLLYNMWQLYPRTRKFFLLTHKTSGQRGSNPWSDWTTTANGRGYTQTELFDAIKATCGVYKVEVIDVFGESEINTADAKYLSEYDWGNHDDMTNAEYYSKTATDWVNSDGVHPLAYGYSHGYLPIVHKAIFGGAVDDGTECGCENRVFVQDTQPENMQDGDVWIDTSDGVNIPLVTQGQMEDYVADALGALAVSGGAEKQWRNLATIDFTLAENQLSVFQWTELADVTDIFIQINNTQNETEQNSKYNLYINGSQVAGAFAPNTKKTSTMNYWASARYDGLVWNIIRSAGTLHESYPELGVAGLIPYTISTQVGKAKEITLRASNALYKNIDGTWEIWVR